MRKLKGTFHGAIKTRSPVSPVILNILHGFRIVVEQTAVEYELMMATLLIWRDI